MIAAAALLLGVATAPAINQNRFAGITIGASVRDAMRPFGLPNVVTTDVGTVWTWDRSALPQYPRLRLTTGDDGTVQMVDVVATSTTPFDIANVPGTHRPLEFGKLTEQAADATMDAPPDFSGSGAFPDGGDAVFHGYRIGPTRELALLFDAKTRLLREAFYGERAALARSGLIPGDTPAGVFKAPVLQKLGGADYAYSKEGTTYLRISVNADGTVSDATAFVSSGDARLDAIAIADAKHSTFLPASLDGKTVPSVYFRREDFIQVKQ